MNDKLLPCPFCGGKARLRPHIPVHMVLNEVECTKCGATSGIQHTTVEGVIEMWNKRVPLKRMIEKLEKESDFLGGEPMGSLQKTYYCKGIEKAIEIVKGGVDNAG